MRIFANDGHNIFVVQGSIPVYRIENKLLFISHISKVITSRSYSLHEGVSEEWWCMLFMTIDVTCGIYVYNRYSQ